MPFDLVIPPTIDRDAPQGLRQLALEASAMSKSAQLHVRVTAEPEAADARAFTLQVTNRRGAVCFGIFALLVIIGTTETGGPGGTQSVSVTTGVQVQQIAAGQAYLVLTDAAGKAVVSVQVTGAGTRYVLGGVQAVMFASKATEWAA